MNTYNFQASSFPEFRFVFLNPPQHLLFQDKIVILEGKNFQQFIKRNKCNLEVLAYCDSKLYEYSAGESDSTNSQVSAAVVHLRGRKGYWNLLLNVPSRMRSSAAHSDVTGRFNHCWHGCCAPKSPL